MKKYGGLDSYLQRRDGKFLGAFGRTLRNELGATIRMKEWQRAEQEAIKTPSSTQERQ